MENKSKVRIIGEIVTLISNILVTFGIIGGLLYLYFIKSISQGLINNIIGVEFYEYGMASNIIISILSYLDSNMWLIFSIVATIITLVWLLREVFIRSTSIITIIFAIILNITNIVGLVGYALILYDNIQIRNNDSLNFDNFDIKDTDNKKLNISNKRYNSSIILAIISILLVISIPVIFNIFSNKNVHQEQYESKDITINHQNPENIIADYDKKSIEAENVITKGNGFYRYYMILIDSLRSYNIDSIENASTVYDLSDKLLNSMYQEFKNNLSEEDFNQLRDEQRIWIKNKDVIEKDNESNELVRYQTLISITLDKCEEWTNHYK